MRLPPLVPAFREATPSLLRDLRQVHRSLTLAHVAEERWWLLRYHPHRDRRIWAGGELARLGRTAQARTWSDAWRAARLAYIGYQLWGDYSFVGEPPREWLLNEAREKVSLTDREMDRRFEMQAAAGDRHEAAKAATIEEYMQLEGRSIFRYVRGRRSYPMKGAA